MTQNQAHLVRKGRRSASRRGSEVIEFTLAFLPLIAMVFLLLDAAWGIFAKSTLEYAVRAGVRQGITITGTQATAAGSNLTAMVKSIVQQNALGLLTGDAGLSKIKVHYFLPPAPGSNDALTDVSGQANGNSSLNIMQVTIEGYALPALVPRIYGWNQNADLSATPVGAIAADLIEPSRDLPTIGAAP
ncbi:MAG: TadE/TadG family type IV pilus assembly protein [Bryobacteraceae bacterium]|jgi:Flp pilus assembly protein TadG